MIDELDIVRLRVSRSADGLAAGALGTVVMVHDQGAVYTVEFVRADGSTAALLTLDAVAVEPASPADIDALRRLDAAE